MEFAGKRAIVTGAAQGIGAELARGIVSRGGQVVLADLKSDGLQRTCAELESIRPGAASYVAGDVGEAEHVRALVARCRDEFGDVDMFFANAGCGAGGGLDEDLEVWERTFHTNVYAHVHAARELVPGWVRRGEGYFVVTASAAGLLSQLGSASYSVSKHAAVAFAEWLALTYSDSGLQVSCVCPMGVDTEILRASVNSEVEAERMGARSILLSGELLAPEAVARTTLDGVERGEFLILPHPDVRTMMTQRAADTDRWLGGMSRLQAFTYGKLAESSGLV